MGKMGEMTYGNPLLLHGRRLLWPPVASACVCTDCRLLFPSLGPPSNERQVGGQSFVPALGFVSNRRCSCPQSGLPLRLTLTRTTYLSTQGNHDVKQPKERLLACPFASSRLPDDQCTILYSLSLKLMSALPSFSTLPLQPPIIHLAENSCSSSSRDKHSHPRLGILLSVLVRQHP